MKLDQIPSETKNTSRNSIILNIIGLGVVPLIGFCLVIFFVFAGFTKIERNAREATNLAIQDARYRVIETEMKGFSKTLALSSTLNSPQGVIAEQFNQLKGAVESAKSSLNIHYGDLLSSTLELQKQTAVFLTLWDKQNQLKTSNGSPTSEQGKWISNQLRDQNSRITETLSGLQAQLAKVKEYQKNLSNGKLGDLRAEKYSQLFFLSFIAGCSLVALVFLSLIVARRISAPIAHIKTKMESFNRGNLNDNIDGLNRSDEFGDVARLLLAFRKNAQNISTLQTQLRDTIQKKQKSAKMKEDVLTQMGEGMKQPLNNIMGFSESIQKDLEVAEKTGQFNFSKMNSDLNNLNSTGSGMMSMIDSVIDLTNDGDEESMEIEEFNAREEVQQILPQVEVEILKNKNRLKVNCPDASIVMNSCSAKIMKAVGSLIKNSAQATSDGTITLEILKAKLGDYDAVRFNVIDNGSGLDMERIKDLNHTNEQDGFDVFSMGALKGNSSKNKKAGLGLVLVKKITKDLHGFIKAERNAAKGTKISLIFPSDHNATVARTSNMTLSPISDAV